MAGVTTIQWADTTVNPIMGCGGCELFPSPTEVLWAIDKAVEETGAKISSRAIYSELIEVAYRIIERPLKGHKDAINTTNIWHLRKPFFARVFMAAGDSAATAAEKAIRQCITCYAAILHLNKGQNLDKEIYEGHKGHAPIFESVTQFPGRAKKTANLRDLLGCSKNRSPWKANLPRLIFVSDMGDAMSGTGNFPFLKSDLISAITSDAGKRHLWLWLTKRPAQLANFAEEIGGLPQNVCAMTSLTGTNEKNLQRLSLLKKVKASMHGLSIEPLWERIPLKNLDLKGIDWVIVGGELGSGNLTRPFALEWAEELRDHCRKKRVAFFLKQLGSNPTRHREPLALKDSHGGEWDEWPDEALKVRQFPKAFHDYRKKEMKRSNKPRPAAKRKVEIQKLPPTNEEKAAFKRLHKIVSKGVKGFVEAGEALIKIRDDKLWRAGSFETWEDYCRSVAGMTRIHAHRLGRV